MDLLTVTTAGSVDDGKSTLIGRLLHDAGALFDDQLEELRRTSAGRGRCEPDFALLTDGLRAEREQGITIDVAYRYFDTDRRRFVIVDSPGHVQHTRNMVCGAAVSGAAVVLVDVRAGVTDQTTWHTFLLALLGIPHLVFAVNKMDLLGWSKDRFAAVADDLGALTARLGRSSPTVIPISALSGANVVHPGDAAAPWYEGPSLLTHLETAEPVARHDLTRTRLPVQGVLRTDGGLRLYTGQLAGGTLRPGDPVVVLPGGARTTVAAVHGPAGPRAVAVPPLSVTVALADHVDVVRGDLLCSPEHAPVPVDDFHAVVCWMDARPVAPGTQLLLKHGTRTTPVELAAVEAGVDAATLTLRPAARLALNDVARVRLRAAEALPLDDYVDNRDSGRFILIDPHDRHTLAAGLVDESGRALGGLS